MCHDNDSPSTAAILIPRLGGHRLLYVRLVCEALLERKIPFRIVAGDDFTSSVEWETHLGALNIGPVTVARGGSLKKWHQAVLDGSGPSDVVICLDGDPALSSLLRRLGSRQVVLLIMRTRRQGGVAANLRFLGKGALLHFVKLVHRRSLTIRYLTQGGAARETLTSKLLPSAPAVDDPEVFQPDAALVSQYQSEVGGEGARPIYLLAGVIDERKESSRIIESFSSSVPQRGTLVLAGKLSPAIANLVESLEPAERARMRVLNRYLADTELDSWVAAADFVLLYYKNNGPSGLMMKAGAAGTVILTGPDSLIHRMALSSGAMVATVPLRDLFDLSPQFAVGPRSVEQAECVLPTSLRFTGQLLSDRVKNGFGFNSGGV